jgi:pimeloyl-ACP methyl ester carboxylesterase
LVRGLILSSAFDYISERTNKVLNQWLRLAQHPAGAEEFSGMFEQKYRPPPEALAELPGDQLLTNSRTPNSERLVRILEELFGLDQREIVSQIRCPTLVIGGEDDRTVPADVQRAMAARIPNCNLVLCRNYGHFNDMENPDYERHVQEFNRRLMSDV